MSNVLGEKLLGIGDNIKLFLCIVMSDTREY